jgi:hypothetical protein
LLPSEQTRDQLEEFSPVHSSHRQAWDYDLFENSIEQTVDDSVIQSKVEHF